MAKVIYPPVVSGIVGRVTTGVYYRARGTRFGYMRSYVMPKITAHNNLLGSYLTNIRLIWVTDIEAAYMLDLLDYANKYKDLPIYGDDSKQRTKSAFAIWYKILMAWQASDPTHVDLSSIVTADIITLMAGNLSIKDQVDEGWLPVVDGYTAYTNDMCA